MSSNGQSLISRGLGVIEWLGNKLPDPLFLFLGATVLVVVLSAVGSGLGWSVQPVRPVASSADVSGAGKPRVELVPYGEPIRARSLVTTDGAYWLTANMVRNFINFAPLGVVLVSMFGIGLAEKVGLFGAAMKQLAGITPSLLLTPTVIMLGICSNIASDAGYIVLPALAGGLYAAAGRPALAGIATAFAGVAGGFSANLLIASTDTLIAPLTEQGARVLDPAYSVLPTCNWYFLAASILVLVPVGWLVTAKITEPRLAASPDGGGRGGELTPLTREERRGLKWALVGAGVAVALVVGLIFIPGAPLHGTMPAAAPAYGPIPVSGPASAGALPPRWSQGVVPLIFVGFLLPGLAYGVASGAIRSTKDVSDALVHSMRTMAPVIAVAFFAAQFIECLKYTRLDTMIAQSGGKLLAGADLPVPVMLAAVILLVMVVNLLVASMSAKWTALSLILVPMMMMTGVSPELTQAAYRVGDSVTNIVTPLNTYIILILAAGQKYRPTLGIGNIVAMMLPYSIAFWIAWTLFLLAYVYLGLPLGPNAPMWYAAPSAP